MTPEITELQAAAERLKSYSGMYDVESIVARESLAIELANGVLQLAPRLADLERQNERLREVLAEWVVQPDYDWPGDAPEICGYQCCVCKALSEDETIEHKTDCPLFTATLAKLTPNTYEP